MKSLKRSDIFNHLQRADGWMRELHGWLWHRRDHAMIEKMRISLIRDTKAMEKLLEKLQDLNIKIK